MLLFKRVFFFFVGLILLYFIWSKLDRKVELPAADGQFRAYNEIGANVGKGNLVGIQPYMMPIDYSSEEAFYNKTKSYLLSAKQKSVLNSKSIVVFPEYYSSWLVAINEKESVYFDRSSEKALQTVVLSNFFSFFYNFLNAPKVTDKIKYSLFATKSEAMAAVYVNTFSKLAKEYNVTIVAGSILLKNPKIVDNQIVIQSGPLYNISAVFGPNGQLNPNLIKKVYPIIDELPFVCKSNVNDIPVFNTPAGKLGVLICADSWNTACYNVLKSKGVQILAVPSYSALDNAWALPWNGYSGTETPKDAKKDLQIITEGEAWHRYAMAGRAKKEGNILKGINVFLRGKIWDLGSDGATIMLSDSASKAYTVDGPTLSVVWL